MSGHVLWIENSSVISKQSRSRTKIRGITHFPAAPGASRNLLLELQVFANYYLRVAQAYMLISMPTGTSTIFGHFQAIRDSPKLRDDRHSRNKVRPNPKCRKRTSYSRQQNRPRLNPVKYLCSDTAWVKSAVLTAYLSLPVYPGLCCKTPFVSPITNFPACRRGDRN